MYFYHAFHNHGNTDLSFILRESAKNCKIGGICVATMPVFDEVKNQIG